ncbi:tetratricopeptide repeat protein [Pseudopedobacter beijingensis]|uniref:Tetratricopeptide repeat protein n=1 Tax=Pseudopedobacter beijingensis TaxID=1207056 RepID=A0ABW4I9P1_9SPHI
MKVFKKSSISYILLVFTGLLLAACASKKKSDKKVSFMKNLTAHYNIYYNASVLLQSAEDEVRDAYKDDFNRRLEIFIVPNQNNADAGSDKLNEVIAKANRIALEKYESNWVDDAFLLLAKAEYYKTNFFNAAEYFSYVSQNFPKDQANTVDALVWHARSLFALDKNKEADSVLQRAYQMNVKRHRSELNAALANSYLLQNKLPEAETHLRKAISFSKNRYSKIRWSYILAQIQEAKGDIESAYSSYGKVVKSNASFEMSFNANLSQIRLKESANGAQFDKIATLHKMLKEDKNKEFKDQIFYQIGAAYEDKGKLDEAISFYQVAAHTEPGSQQQKALSYLRLAEINFDTLRNYSQAQLYYDSTLQTLPKEYPSYKNVSLMAQNLQYLADRLTIITHERELLTLADMSEADREDFVKQKIKEETIVASTNDNTSNIPGFNPTSNSLQTKSSGTFYFDNTTAISQGINEFKKKWGDRKLADNWRISAGVSNASVDHNIAGATVPLNLPQNNTANIDSLRANFLKQVPTTQAQKDISLNKIKNARYEIAMFYKEQLNDNEAATQELEQALSDYKLPDPKVAEIYYQLYRLYSEINTNKSDFYRQQLIKHFPESVYAKTLINPDFGKEKEAEERRLSNQYESIYNLVQGKQYKDAISQISGMESRLQSFPQQASRFAYLKALAIGYTEKPGVFVNELQNIQKRYPDDTLINGQIKKQLAFIENNKNAFYNRSTALISYDPNEIIPPLVKNKVNDKPVVVPDVPKEKQTPAPKALPAAKETQLAGKETPKTAETPLKTLEQATENIPAVEEVKAVKEPEKPKLINFSNNIRIRHAIVIDVKNVTINVAKPFAALTKHFYSNFAPGSVNLTIRTIDSSDKLIIVKGPFLNKDQAEKALAEISPSLAEILGLKKGEYETFVISDPNLLLINNTESLNQYLNFIK